MKNIVSFLICISFSFHLNGQVAGFNYIPLEFETLEPEWIHDIYDSTIIGHVIDENPIVEFDGYSHVVRSQYTNPRYIVRDDAVYLVSRFQYNNDIGGAIVEKIDLATGQPEWKTVFDLRTQDIREYALNIEIKDNRLVLYCIYLNEDNGHLATMIGNGLGFLSRKEYDIDTGLLVQQTTPDTTANDIVLLRSPLYDSELHFLSDTSIQVIRLGRKFESGSFLVIDTMDMDGVRLTPTYTLSHELYLDWEDVYGIRANLFEKDTFTGEIYSIDYFKPNSQGPEARTSQLLRYSKYHGREIVPFEYSNYDNVVTINIRQVTETHLIMDVHKEDNMGSDFLFVDKVTGAIDRTISYAKQLADGFDLFLYEDEVMVMNFSKIGTYYYMDIYKSVGSEMQLLKSFKLGFPDYIIRGSSLHMLDDGDFLVEFQYQGRQNGLPRGAFSGIMRITSEQLGLTTSTKEVTDITVSPFRIYPNPASDELYINSNEIEPYSVIIYDVMGRKQMSSNDHLSNSKINIDGLPPGQYYVQLISKSNSYTTKIIKN
jgi:hypothetical protein